MTVCCVEKLMFLRKENIPDDFPDVPLLIELSTGSWNVKHVNDVKMCENHLPMSPMFCFVKT